jgi:aldehyde:ferredoxin oxidoreductase
MIARRTGFGDVLAEGTARMSKRFGPDSEPFDLSVKGQELPMHEPRLKPALGVGYAVAPVGADHMMNMHDTVYGQPGRGVTRVNSASDRSVEAVSSTVLRSEDKLQIFYHEVNWRHFQDCAIICHFYCYDYSHLAEALSGVTGVEYSIHDVLDVGARAQTLARLFNLREGLTAADDRLPRRVMTPLDDGPIEGFGITDDDFEWFKGRFYEMMGWDRQTGEPTADCLSRLKLDGLLG